MTEANEWAGAVGDVWAAEWRRTDRSFAGLATALDAAILAAAPGNRSAVRLERSREAGAHHEDHSSTSYESNGHGQSNALEIGCGAGATSLALARARSDLAITGVDLSPGLLAVARERAAGLDNITFVEGDVIAAAGRLAPVDLFVSRHGVMFFDDPVRAFAALHAAASPSAALVFSCFRSPAQNPWVSEVVEAVTGAPLAPRGGDAPGPFAFADETRVAGILADAGWVGAVAAPIDYTYRAGEGDDPVADAVSFFSRIGPSAPILRNLLADQREATLAGIAEVCARHRHGDAIDFPAAAWIWSARAS